MLRRLARELRMSESELLEYIRDHYAAMGGGGQQSAWPSAGGELSVSRASTSVRGAAMATVREDEELDGEASRRARRGEAQKGGS